MSTNSSSLLKGGSRLTLIALLILFVLILVYYFCGREKRPLIEFREKVKAPQAVAFLYRNTGGAIANIPKVKVTFIDESKMIVSSNGIPLQSVELTSGVMNIGLSSKATFSTDNPYRFFIRAEAEGYMTNIRSVVITEDSPNYVPIYLAKLDDLPPSGLAASVGNITAVDGGVLQRADTLRAIPGWGQLPPVTVAIPKGVQFLCGDKRITAQGPLSFRLLYGAPRDSNANRIFPGGFEVTDAVDETGKSLAEPNNPIFFTTAGWFALEMKIGNESINGFSEPLTVEMPVSDSITNPETQQPIKAGDQIPLWSMDNRTGIWTRESSVLVMNGDNGMKVSFPIKHLSEFNLDVFTGTTCTIQVPYNTTAATANDFTGTYFTEYVRTADNSVIRGKSVDFSAAGGGSPLNILRVPTGASGSGRLYVHNGTDITSPLRGMSSNLNCSTPGPAGNSLGRLGSASFPCVTLRFVDGANNPVLCMYDIWHKQVCGSANWVHAGNLSMAGNLDVPAGALGPQCILLWFADAVGTPVTLSLPINFSNSNTNQQGEINEDPAQTFLFDYTVSAVAGTCSTLITVTIQDFNNLVLNNNIACP